jgi:hypothetical protein
VAQYLAIEEFSVLQQIQSWTAHPDRALSDLAQRFLNRNRLAMIEAPDFSGEIAPDYQKWEIALRELVARKTEYDPPESYCLADQVRAKHNEPYLPEHQQDEQSAKNAIRVKVEGEGKPVEVSKVRPRLKPLTEKPLERRRYYLPKELQAEAVALRNQWK